MKANKKQNLWLNQRRGDFLNQGQKLFDEFKIEFNLETDEARELIHSWDCDLRGIEPGKPKLN